MDLNDLSLHSRSGNNRNFEEELAKEKEANGVTSANTNNKPPPLDLKKAALIQAHFVNKAAGESDKDVKVQLNEARKSIERLTTEKTDLMLKLEESMVSCCKLDNELRSVRKSHAETQRVNILLTRACLIYEKRWTKICSHFNFLQHFYCSFNEAFSPPSLVDAKSLVKELKRFKDGFITERAYNPDLMEPHLHSSAKFSLDKIERFDVDKVGDLSPKENFQTRQDETLPLRGPSKSHHFETPSGKNAILKIARDVYSNKQISNLVPDPKEFLDVARVKDRVQLQNIWKEKPSGQ